MSSKSGLLWGNLRDSGHGLHVSVLPSINPYYSQSLNPTPFTDGAELTGALTCPQRYGGKLPLVDLWRAKNAGRLDTQSNDFEKPARTEQLLKITAHIVALSGIKGLPGGSNY